MNSKKADLLPGKKRLNYQLAARGFQNSFDSIYSFRLSLRDGDALTRCQVGIFNNEGEGCAFQIPQRPINLCKPLERRRGDVVPRHKRLGKTLRALELRRLGVRTKNAQARRLERIDNARDERHFGTNYS